MISFNKLQTYYIKLYTQLRNYSWDFKTVEIIADLETSVHRAFPDLAEVRRNLVNLRTRMTDVIRDDEDLQKAYDRFYDVLQNETEVYAKLPEVHEVIQ